MILTEHEIYKSPQPRKLIQLKYMNLKLNKKLRHRYLRQCFHLNLSHQKILYLYFQKYKIKQQEYKRNSY